MTVRWVWKYPKEIGRGDRFRGRWVTETVEQEDGRWVIVLADGESIIVRQPGEMLRVIPGSGDATEG